MEENKRKFNWKTAAIIVMAGLLIFCLAKINDMSDEIATLQNTISNCQHQISNMQSNIDSIYNNVDELLKKEASLLSSVDYTLGELNKEDHTIPVTLNVVPKSLTDDMQLSVKVGNETFDFERNGNEFSATFSVNIFGVYKDYPMLNIKTAGNSKTEMLERVDLTTLYTRYLPNIYANITANENFTKGKLSISGDFHLDVKPSRDDSDISITKVELITEKNKKEIAREDITKKLGTDYEHLPIEANYEANYGDEICVYTVVEDSLGYTYKILSYYWYEIDENTSQAIAAVGEHTEIYDHNGNLLTGGY